MVGTHIFEFQCQLPDQIPASFSTKEGSIYYHVEAVLNKPWRLNERIKKPFVVTRNESINDFPGLFTPTTQEKTRKFGVLFWTSKPFSMSVTLPFSGFEPDDDLAFKICYNNQSNVDVSQTKVELRRVVKLTRLSHSYIYWKLTFSFTNFYSFQSSTYSEKKI